MDLLEANKDIINRINRAFEGDGEEVRTGEQFLVFECENLFGFSILETHEILKPALITRLPNAEAEILGMINLRGDIIPVVDLRHKFYRAYTEPGPSSRIIICHQNNTRYQGFLVDRIVKVVNIAEESIEWTDAPAYSSNLVSGIGRAEASIFMILNLEELVYNEA